MTTAKTDRSLALSDVTTPPTTTDPFSNWCPVERPFPDSYEAAVARDPAHCVAEDPCSPDGMTTLWHGLPCVIVEDTVASTTVASGGVLPQTGSDTVLAFGLGALFVCAGVALLHRW